MSVKSAVQAEFSPLWPGSVTHCLCRCAAAKWFSALTSQQPGEVGRQMKNPPWSKLYSLFNRCMRSCVCAPVHTCMCVIFQVLFTLGKPSHAIWSQASSNPPQIHTHASTSQHWELLEETRCYLTKTCWRQCVWVRRAAGIADTLLPYVHSVCSPSAALVSADFLQKFLQGNRSLLSRWLHRLSGSVSVLRFCQQPPATASLGYICWSWACFLLPSVAAPTAGTGSVGFPHSANFTLLLQTSPALAFLLSIFILLVPWFFIHLPFSHLQPPSSLEHVFSMCADSLPGVCRCSPYHSTSHKPIPAPPNTHTHRSIFPFRHCHVCPDGLI